MNAVLQFFVPVNFVVVSENIFQNDHKKQPEAKTENLADVLFSGQVEFAPHFTAQNIHTLTPVT